MAHLNNLFGGNILFLSGLRWQFLGVRQGYEADLAVSVVSFISGLMG